jgi:flagellar biogenesis protein FliO
MRSNRNPRKSLAPVGLAPITAVMIVALAVAMRGRNAAAYERPSDASYEAGTSAEQSPRYLPQQRRGARSLPAVETEAKPLPAQLRAAERLAGNETADAQPEPRALTPQNRELPLSAPPAEEKKGWRAGEMPALATGAASLGIVLGLFLVIIWAVRRGLPRGAGVLPGDAVEVLGRAPFVGKQHVHLVRCGNKLLLVCVSPGSVQTLTEITDPAEVERLAGLAQGRRAAPGSFRETLEQFAPPPNQRYFTERDAEEVSLAMLDTGATHARSGGVL